MPFIFTNLHPKGDWKMQTFTSVLKINILCGFRHSVLSQRCLGKCLRLGERQKGSREGTAVNSQGTCLTSLLCPSGYGSRGTSPNGQRRSVSSAYLKRLSFHFNKPNLT